MASLAHVVVGMGAGRVATRREDSPAMWMLGFAILSMLPDVDVIAFRLGIPYSATFGHRGATHSLLFGLLAAICFTVLAARYSDAPWPKTAALACIVAVSHPLLDSLTNGGRGVALLWPFSNERFFAPWRPIPVAPIGARMLSNRGLHVMLFEAFWSAPLLLWALWPRRTAQEGTGS
jgi:inner membrane protein